MDLGKVIKKDEQNKQKKILPKKHRKAWDKYGTKPIPIEIPKKIEVSG